MGIPCALSLTTPHPLPRLGMSSAGQLLGVGWGDPDNGGACDWATPCQGALGRESPCLKAVAERGK